MITMATAAIKPVLSVLAVCEDTGPLSLSGVAKVTEVNMGTSDAKDVNIIDCVFMLLDEVVQFVSESGWFMHPVYSYSNNDNLPQK